METRKISTLKINTLVSQEQYDKAYDENKIEQDSIYLVPDNTEEIAQQKANEALENAKEYTDLAIQNKANTDDLNNHTEDTTIHVTEEDKDNWNAKSEFSGDYNDLDNKPTIPSINGLATETYVDEKVGQVDIPGALSELTEDETHRVVTDAEKATWNAKSDFSGSYNDLTDKPEIPSIEGLASETFVNSAVSTKADSEHNHDDVYYTETEVDAKFTTVNQSIDTLNSEVETVKGDLTSHATSSNTQFEAIRSEFAQADTSTLTTAKEYSDANKSAAVTEAKAYTDSEIEKLVTDTEFEGVLTTIQEIQNAMATDDELAQALEEANGKKIDKVEKGSSTKPIYLDSTGTPQEIAYKIEQDLPADAKLTDTTYTLIKDATQKKIQLMSGETLVSEVDDNNTTYEVATTSNSGLLSAEDKTKLDGIETGATKTVVDSELSDSSTNAIQNKVIKGALDNKADTSHTHTIANVTDLQTTLDGKSNTGHTHTAGDVSGLANVATSGDYKDLSNQVGKDVTGTEYTISETTVTADKNAEIFNDYTNNIASGKYSHAEGYGTTASGFSSHAKGYGTTASGHSSYAEGIRTIAAGYYSHAEGQRTLASGNISHAEGSGTKASGANSHVQGKYNIEDTEGKYAHIVGNGNYDTTTQTETHSNAHTLDWDGNAWFAGKIYIGGTSQDDATELGAGGVGENITGQSLETASGTFATAAEGAEIFNDYRDRVFETHPFDATITYAINGNIATGNYSHAEGQSTTASGSVSHAEGNRTIASGDISHAEGHYSEASGNYSHAEGRETIANGENSHAEGYQTTASDSYSHAEGYKTTASSDCSHAEGYITTASGIASHAEGDTSKAKGYSSHAEGYKTTASGQASHAEGNSTTASGYASHAEGTGTTVSGDSQHTQGKYNIEDTEGKYAHIVGNGTADDARSNAHTLDWDGNAWFAGKVYVGGTSQDDATELSGIPSGGSSGQVLKWSEDGTATWGTISSGKGWSGTGINAELFNSAKTASGNFSHAEGYQTNASSYASHAEGYETIASGSQSHAEGRLTIASGNYSHAEGGYTTASGNHSHAEGDSYSNANKVTTSTDNAEIITAWTNAAADKRFSLAKGEASHVEGLNCLALGDFSHAEGMATKAVGSRSHAGGQSARAYGYASLAHGYYTTTSNADAEGTTGYAQAVFGKYNTIIYSPSTGDTQDSTNADALFIVGCGTSSATKNAFRVTSGGKCYGANSFGSSGADFAELFEWADGNPDNEDRRGLFVALEGEKIRIANADDDYIGIISDDQAFIGNSASEEWQGKYLTDIFGGKLTQEVEVPEVVDEITGEVIEPATTAIQYVLNPDYNPDEEYIMRENRKEWGIVGLVGQIVLIDDGSCVVGGRVVPKENGIGTASTTKEGYRVMARLDETHIKVLVK